MAKSIMCRSWQPASFKFWDVTLLITVCVAQILVRALDYMISDTNPDPYRLVEEAFPIKLWAIFLVISAAVLILGWLVKSHIIVFVGHGLLAMFYTALFLGILLPAITELSFNGMRGMRSATTLMLPTVFNALLCLRTGPVPLPSEWVKVSESVGEPA